MSSSSYNNTIKAALLATVLPAALAQDVQEITINGFTDVQGKTFFVNHLDAIKFSWTGDYDPLHPDSHYKIKQSTADPLPYTVTPVDVCDGDEAIADCTWSWMVAPTELDIDGGKVGYRINFLTNHGNNAKSNIEIDYGVPQNDDGWRECPEDVLSFVQARMPNYLYRVDALHLCEYQETDAGKIYHVQFDLLDDVQDEVLGKKVKDVLAYEGSAELFEFDCIENIFEGEESMCLTYVDDDAM